MRQMNIRIRKKEAIVSVCIFVCFRVKYIRFLLLPQQIATNLVTYSHKNLFTQSPRCENLEVRVRRGPPPSSQGWWGWGRVFLASPQLLVLGHNPWQCLASGFITVISASPSCGLLSSCFSFCVTSKVPTIASRGYSNPGLHLQILTLIHLKRPLF